MKVKMSMTAEQILNIYGARLIQEMDEPLFCLLPDLFLKIGGVNTQMPGEFHSYRDNCFVGC
jgi:hypothetical protein